MPSKKITLFITTLSSFITPFMSSSINIALPSIGKEFHSTAIILSWIASSFLLTTAILLLPVGKFTDKYGRIRLFKTGIVVFTLSSFLSSVAVSSFVLIFARIIQAIGASMLFSTAMAILVSAFPLNERGKVLGINTAAVYIGLSSGPFIGGLLTQLFNWRFIFLFSGLLGLIVIVLSFVYYKDDEQEKNENPYDIFGAFIYSSVIFLLLFGFSIMPSANGIICTSLGFIGLIYFLNYELKVTYPILDIVLFKENKTYAFSNLAALINYAATFAVSFLLSFYLQYVKNMNPHKAGLILIIQPITQALLSPIAGKTSDKVEPQKVASLGMMIITVGLFNFVFLGRYTNLYSILIALGLLGFGFALFSSPNTNAIMSSVKKAQYGTAASTVSTMRMVGQMLSMSVVMMMFSIFIGKEKVSSGNIEALLLSIKYIFIVFTVLCFGGIFASLARGKIH